LGFKAIFNANDTAFVFDLAFSNTCHVFFSMFISTDLFDFRPHCQRQQLEGCKLLLNDFVYDNSNQMGLLS
jgi:hypothetical protein